MNVQKEKKFMMMVTLTNERNGAILLHNKIAETSDIEVFNALFPDIHPSNDDIAFYVKSGVLAGLHQFLEHTEEKIKHML